MNDIKKLSIYIAAFLLSLAALVLTWNNIFVLTLFGLVAWGIILYYNKNELIYLVLGALIGTLAEIILIHFGAWNYTTTTFLGIPLWLPLVWGMSIVIIKNISSIIENMLK